MSTYTESLGLELITPGSQAGLWGNTTNNSLNLIDQAITGVTPISFASASGTTYTLTDYNGAEDEARAAVLNITGTATGTNTVIVPNKQKTYLVRNETSRDIVFQTLAATTPYIVLAGYNTLIFCDGNNGVFAGIRVPGASTLGVSGGGTGKTTFATAGFLKTPGGTGDFTSSATADLASEVSGILPVANGGTGVTSFTSGGVLLGNGSGSLSTITASPSATNYVLRWNGSTWYAGDFPASGITSITAGVGISVTGTTNVTVTNAGVTSLSAGTGISLSATTGGITVTNTGPTLTGANTWSGSNTFSSQAAFNGNAIAPIFYAGSSISASSVLQPGSLNFYSSSVGNHNNTSIAYGGGPSLAAQAYYLSFDNSGSPAVNYQFFGDGTAYKPGGGSWTALSDARLKGNVVPLSGALDKITSLNPVSYSWKVDSQFEPTVGFIAQEVEQVMPNAVTRRDPTEAEKEFVTDKTLNVGWQNDMIAYLVGAIKELKAEIDALKAAK